MDSVLPEKQDGKGSSTPLREQHVSYLKARAVPLLIAIAAGLRSVDATQGAALLGLDRPAAGLAIPYIDETGEIVAWRIRLDDAGEEGTKFLTARAPVRPYLPPTVAPAAWTDPEVDICFAEGPIKALALSAAGFPCVGLGGVSAGGHDAELWRKDRQLAPHRDLPRRLGLLRDRRTVIAFDAGRARNQNVALGEAMLATVLSSSGAAVRAVALPPLADGRDRGPDDYIAVEGKDAFARLIADAGPADPLERVRAACADPDRGARGDAAMRLLQDLPFIAHLRLGGKLLIERVADEMKRKAGISKMAIAERVLAFGVALADRAKGDGAPNASGSLPYRTVDGRLCIEQVDRRGERFLVPLANFDARIIEELRRDDGAEVVHLFRVAGTLADGTVLPTTDVPATDFVGLSWIPRSWGARAAPAAGLASRDRLREALQVLSTPITREVYGHTGWRSVGGASVFLHGARTDIEVDLAPPLDRYRLPDAAVDPVAAVGLSLEFLRCGPPAITIPHWALAYRAVTASLLPIDLVVWSIGPTGNWKSTLAALVLAHFGEFDRLHLPANWSATDNSLETALFVAKDVLVVIDDFAPQRQAQAQRELEKKAQRILRGIGNQSGRGRLRADLTQRPDRPPRGAVLCTGEELPPGASIRARSYVIEVDREKLDREAVSRLQREAPRLPHAMSSYIAWLAPQIDDLRRHLPEAFQVLRDRARNLGRLHDRLPEAVAHLYLGLDLGLRFAQEIGAVRGVDADAIRDEGWRVFISGAERTGRLVGEADPAQTFLAILTTALAQGRAALAADRKTQLDAVMTPGSSPVGWMDDVYVYLLPEAARQIVVRTLRDEGLDLGASARMLNEALVRLDAVVPGDDGRPEVVVRCGGPSRRVLRVRHAALGIETAGTGQGQGPTGSSADAPSGTGRLGDPVTGATGSGGDGGRNAPDERERS